MVYDDGSVNTIVLNGKKNPHVWLVWCTGFWSFVTLWNTFFNFFYSYAFLFIDKIYLGSEEWEGGRGQGGKFEWEPTWVRRIYVYSQNTSTKNMKYLSSWHACDVRIECVKLWNGRKNYLLYIAYFHNICNEMLF